MIDPQATNDVAQGLNRIKLVPTSLGVFMKIYETDKQFQQEAIVFVALSLNEAACALISDGNIAQGEEVALFELINIARSKSFDIGTMTAIGMYANLVQEENDAMRVSFGKGQ